MKTHSFLIFAATALSTSLAVPAFAQTIYKSVQPDGRVIYSDRPVTGASKVQRIGSNEETLSLIPNPRARQESREEIAAERRIQERQIALDRADAEVKAATLAVESVQAQLQAGEEPLPGERTGNAGGGTRLNDVYVGRLAALQQQLFEAQQRLNAAYAARNSVRD